MDKIILHIDFDSFFASVEQQHNPLLRGKPIGVTAANSRTCIIAASREAKKFGIKTGTRSFETQNICPAITLVPANFVNYWEVSKKFINICKDYSPYIEVFSIDELFMDITSSHHLFGGQYGVIARIRNRIKKEIGEYITASFGISYNKLLAKLASGLQKPNGIVEIRKEDVYKIYKQAKLTDVCGIGERIKNRLNKIGIYTLLQLREVPISCLISEFGQAEAYFLHQVGLANDPHPVIPYTISPSVKSVGRNYCLPENQYNRLIVLQNIYELCEEVGLKLRRLEKKAKTIGISLRGSLDMHGEKTVNYYINSGKDIFYACKFLISDKFMIQTHEYIRQISVWVSNLEDVRYLPYPLFKNEQKTERLLAAVDNINERFGDHTIRNGFLLYADKLTTVPNGYLADKYERTKLSNEL